LIYSFTRKLYIGVDGNKGFSKGDSGSLATNPLIVNSTLEWKIFKENRGSIQLQAFDIFNETNNLVRSVTDNTITDNRTNFITRYFKIKFTMRLSKFGSVN
jgi:hypothetical protein